MGRMTFVKNAAVASFAVILAAQPALADVKAGVDAWSAGKHEAAVKEWRGPAQKGDPDAQYDLGYAYLVGRGVKKDENMALDLFRKSAAQGHLRAADSIGHVLHFQGKISEALPYLQASSSRGEPRSQYLLGVELFNGTKIPKDWVRAYALMTRASAAGMEMATRTLPKMDQYIPLEQRQQSMVLAGELEQDANRSYASQTQGFPIDTMPPPATTKPITVPPSQIPPSTSPGFPSNIPAVGTQPAYPAPVPSKPVSKPAVAASGNWRIQLGAFGNEGNARNLWSSLESQVSDLAGLQPYLNAAGSVTRLQAGPFVSKASAESMCAKVKAKASGQACIAVAR